MKSKATQLLEAILSTQPKMIQLMVRMHPLAKRIADIPDSAVDEIAPKLMELLHEWYPEREPITTS